MEVVGKDGRITVSAKNDFKLGNEPVALSFTKGSTVWREVERKHRKYPL